MVDELDDDDERVTEEQEEEAIPEKPKKVFINHVDTFHGKHIARVGVRVDESIVRVTIVVF